MGAGLILKSNRREKEKNMRNQNNLFIIRIKNDEKFDFLNIIGKFKNHFQ